MSGRVAVIAVHGVADQPPFATARATADLLKCHLGDEASEFREEPLRIEVHPLRAPRPAEGSPASGEPRAILAATAQVGREAVNAVGSSSKPDPSTMWHAGVDLVCDAPRPSGVGDEAKRRVRLNADGGVQESTAEQDERERKEIVEASLKASDEYYAAQLSEYRQQPADAVYETVRLSSTIRGKQVDVFEMYWADLSRVQNGIFQAVEELYYVLFAVCNIGRMELERSRSLFTGKAWSCLRWCEGFAERFLTLILPLGNACLLLLLIFALPHLLPKEVKVESRAFLGIAGAGIGLLAGIIYFVSSSRRRPERAACFLLIGVVGGAVGYGIGCLPHRECIRIMLSALMGLACAGILWGLGRRLNKRQPGASAVSFAFGVLLFVVVIGESFSRAGQDKYWALDIGLAAAEWILTVLGLLWLAYLFAALGCAIFGGLAVCGEGRSPARRSAAKRLVWTANLAVLAPGMLFVVMNLGIWEAVYLAGSSRIEMFFPAALSHRPIALQAKSLNGLAEIEDLVLEERGIKTPPSCPPGGKLPNSIPACRVPGLLLHQSALPMVIVLAAVFSMLLLAAWFLLPAILSEGATDTDPEYARQLGNSLSNAWKWMRFSADILVQGQLFVMIAVFCLGLLARTVLLPFEFHFDLEYLLFTFSGPALAAMGGLFILLATGASQYVGLRSVVDVAADVANWLRLHPRDNNPTSRISARFVSLLRHVAQWKDADGNPYDRVVIFAHSLGSAITVDLLQFLESHPDPNRFGHRAEGAPQVLPRISLFTHGCPLRQLLGLRLPFTYGWAWHGSKLRNDNPKDWDANNGWDTNVEPAGNKLLGVEQWVNAYCSGDYVGRYLWHDDVDDVPWDATRRTNAAAHNANPATVPRVELCVGAGAHVHYWDPNPQAAGAGANGSSAPSTKIAKELVTLIG